jgi:chemotaxis protein methyltransferase CheR
VRTSPVEPEPELKDRDFRHLAGLIHEASGVRLGDDKRELLASRLRPLLRSLGVASFAALSASVRADRTGERLALLVDRATTNTTGFFRHGPQLELLRARLPGLATRGKLRIWSAGCSSGEEPYSVALLIVSLGLGGVAKVLATDVSQRALARAKRAVYDADALESVPPRYRGQFVREPGGGFALDAETRSLVHLRHHDLRHAARGARSVFDAILCRNVLIYFEPRERKAAVARLSDVLRPGGLLLLGPSESGIELPASFRRVGAAAYEKG